jgi:hypothetical protein
MPNVKVTLKAGLLRSSDGGVRMTYNYDVPYGARLIDVPIDLSQTYIDSGPVHDYAGAYSCAQGYCGNRLALAFPLVNENRLQYYEYGLSGHDRFYWGDRFYYDQILWGKYKWDSTIKDKRTPIPGWQEDYPGVLPTNTEMVNYRSGFAPR